MRFKAEDHPHRRYNPLNGQWVLISPHRAKRPWQGQRESSSDDARPAYDPDCYLSPGNERAGGEKKPLMTALTFLPTISPPCSRIHRTQQRKTTHSFAAAGCVALVACSIFRRVTT